MSFKGTRAVFIVLLLGMSMLVAGVHVMDDETNQADWGIWLEGPWDVMLGEENRWEIRLSPGDISDINFTYTWTISGEVVEEDSDVLNHTFHTMGTWTIEVTVEDEDNNTHTAGMYVRVRTDVSVNVVNEDYTPLENAYAILSNDEGYPRMQRTDEMGDTVFRVEGPLGASPEELEFSMKAWCSGYALKTEDFTGTEHQIVLTEEDDISPPVEDGVYVDNIRLEMRLDQNAALFDTAMGDLDAFLQEMDGKQYSDHNESFKDLIHELESYGSYTELSLNTAWTEDSRMVLDTVGNGNTNDFIFNPFAVREIRHALNHLIDREHIVEDIYGGYSRPRYQAIFTDNHAYDEHLRWIDEKYNFTPQGDFDLAYNMIQDAMTEAMNNPALEGDLRPPVESPTPYWQYRPPGGDWGDVQIPGLIRIEDSRLQIGRLISDLLGDCGISVDRIEGGNLPINIWLFTDPADFQWGFITGGWISSVTVAYQHGMPIQFYTDYNGFMPGGFYGPSGRYYYRRDEPGAQNLIDYYALPLMKGEITDEETYWEYVRHISEYGVYDSARIFIETSADVVTMNRERVTEVAHDTTTGWSQFFSPRTIKTPDGNFNAAQLSWSNQLYMDNWNDIHGSGDYHSILAQRMSYDTGTTLHPVRGKSIPMRADFVADQDMAEVFNSRYHENIVPGEFMIRKDYEFDGDGALVRNLDVPTGSDVWFYDVQREEWINGAHTYDSDTKELVAVDKVATAVTYNYHLGTWHTGHELTLRDILASHAFRKQLSYGEEWGALGGAYFHSNFATQNRHRFQNIHAIEIVDAVEGIITYYGDYTFPADSEICGYYGSFPMHPWQLYEAVSHLRGETEYADSDNTEHDRYEWTNIAGTNYVHWISEDQTVDFRNTLINLKNAQWLPPYISGPIAVNRYHEIGVEIDAITDWQNTYGLSWITQGPFKIVEYNTADGFVMMERHGQVDGYPFPDDHWSELLAMGVIRHGEMDVPSRIITGEPLDLTIEVEIEEEYPSRRVRDVDTDRDRFVSTLVIKDHEGIEVFSDSDPELVIDNGTHLRFNVSGSVTTDWTPGSYDIEVTSRLSDQLVPDVSHRSVTVTIPVFQPENLSLEVTPIEGYSPLEVNITVGASNSGGAQGEIDVYAEGNVIHTLELPANGTRYASITHIFQDPGLHEVTFGELTEMITVLEPMFEPVDPELIVTPLEGTAPLEVNITVRANNTGQLDGTLEVVIHEGTVYSLTIPAGEGAEHTFNHVLQEPGTYVVHFAGLEEEVIVQEPVPELTNLQLSVYPRDGEAPLEDVVIFISGDNTGEADGELELLIDDVVKYTLTIPAGGSAEHTMLHTFREPGTYHITFHNLTATVLVVEPEKEDEPSDTDAPLWILPVIGIIIVLLALMYYIYKTTRKSEPMDVYDKDMYGDEDMYMEEDEEAGSEEVDIS